MKTQENSITGIKKFKIEIPVQVIEDLKSRLNLTRWPDEVENVGWEYGTNLSYLKELVDYWLNQYDWHVHQEFLNSFDQFKVDIDDCSVHFVHVKGKGSNPTPIVLSHGWPSSFTEMLKIIPMLTDPEAHGGRDEDSFDVVVPSLPGFAFSSPREHGHIRAHELWAKLMVNVLGYDRFIAQGTDVGASVTTELGRFFPENVMGIHLSSVDFHWPDPLPQPEELSDAEKQYLANFAKWEREEYGYGHIQGTRPQTLAYGLNDSPVGLAAWIIEKYYQWSDCNGDIESRFSKDELLTNIMIYWITQTINSSSRQYYYSRNKINSPPPLKPGERVEVPVGIAMFPGEKDIMVPREFGERCYNIQHWADLPAGGHFAALEEPELLVNDIRRFARMLRKKNSR